MSNIIKPGRIQRKYYKLMKEYIRGIPAFSVIIILVFIFIGVFGTFITPHDPNEVHFESALTPPSFCKSGSTKYLLGTDQLGRDVLSRLIVGARISLEVGFTVVILAGFIGSVVALL
jgi:peptide/nickel transport system permease protein